MSESKLQGKILAWLKVNGFYSVKTIVSNKKGVPDILACSPTGRFIAIEVKYGTNKASKLQDYNIKQIRECGGFAIVCWDLNSLIYELIQDGVIDANDN